MDYRVKKLTYSGMAFAAAFLLPFLTLNNQALGNMLCLMHIPVLLCGFVCGPVWGGVVGFSVPLLRGLTLLKPPLIPIGVPMAAELCAYGLFAGLLYKLLPKKPLYTYISLVSSMVFGRLVWGAAKSIVLGFKGEPFTLALFWTQGFVKALPGIAIQVVLIPIVVIALEKAKLMPRKPHRRRG